MSAPKKPESSFNIAQAIAAVNAAKKTTQGGAPTTSAASPAAAQRSEQKIPTAPTPGAQLDADHLAKAAAKALEEQYASEPIDPNIQFRASSYSDDRPFPVNKLIVTLLLIGGTYVAVGNNQEKIIAKLPESLKPKFVKIMRPFIKKEYVPPTLLDTKAVNSYQNRAARAADDIDRDDDDKKVLLGDKEYQINDKRQFVQIKGKYYPYNPENTYVVDGVMIYYKDPRVEPKNK